MVPHGTRSSGPKRVDAPRRCRLFAAHALGKYLADGATAYRDPAGVAHRGVVLKDINMTMGGVTFWHAIISIKSRPATARSAAAAYR